jgi:hypothetical protein
VKAATIGIHTLVDYSVGLKDREQLIMGHPGLTVPGIVSLCEAMGMSHFALN